MQDITQYMDTYNRYGTCTTFDTPADAGDQSAALEYLRARFGEIGGHVWRKMNAHDFGAYPSFEIDYPLDIKDLIEAINCGYEIREDDQARVDQWHDKMNDIEEEYNNKFTI
jgi:hypothetical protein